MDEQTRSDSAGSGKRNAAIAAGVLGSVLVIVALVWFVTSTLRDQGEEAQRTDTGLERYRDDWESAMSKAGVDATFPGGPVNLEEVTATGSQRFTATFTPAEISALLVVYRYQSDSLEGRADFEDLTVAFPDEDTGVLEGRFIVAGEPYQARIRARAAYAGDEIVIDRGDASLSVEGISIGGKRRNEAVVMVSDYLNEMLDAAPGLTVDEARIVPGGVQVEGTCPVMIEHPGPRPSSGKGAARADTDRG